MQQVRQTPPASFWVGLAMAAAALTPFIAAFPADIKPLLDYFPITFIYLPLFLIWPAVIILMLVGLWRCHRVALSLYMAALPLAVPALLAQLYTLVTHHQSIADDNPSDAVYALRLSLAIVVALVFIVLTEWLAVRDWHRRVKA